MYYIFLFFFIFSPSTLGDTNLCNISQEILPIMSFSLRKSISVQTFMASPLSSLKKFAANEYITEMEWKEMYCTLIFYEQLVQHFQIAFRSKGASHSCLDSIPKKKVLQEWSYFRFFVTGGFSGTSSSSSEEASSGSSGTSLGTLCLVMNSFSMPMLSSFTETNCSEMVPLLAFTEYVSGPRLSVALTRGLGGEPPSVCASITCLVCLDNLHHNPLEKKIRLGFSRPNIGINYVFSMISHFKNKWINCFTSKAYFLYIGKEINCIK